MATRRELLRQLRAALRQMPPNTPNAIINRMTDEAFPPPSFEAVMERFDRTAAKLIGGKEMNGLKFNAKTIKGVTVDIGIGEFAPEAIMEMLELANFLDVPVKSELNGIQLEVSPGENFAELMVRHYSSKVRAQ